MVLGFYSCSLFPVPNVDCGKNEATFGVHKGSSVHTDSKKKDILVLDKGPTEGLDDRKITAEAEYSSNCILY